MDPNERVLVVSAKLESEVLYPPKAPSSSSAGLGLTPQRTTISSIVCVCVCGGDGV